MTQSALESVALAGFRRKERLFELLVFLFLIVPSMRQIPLPKPVDVDRVSAILDKGIVPDRAPLRDDS